MNKVFIDNRVLTMQEFVNTPSKTFKHFFHMSRTPKGRQNVSGNRIVFLQGKKSFNWIYRSNKSLSPKASRTSANQKVLTKQVSRSKKLKPISGQEFMKIITQHRASIQSVPKSKSAANAIKSRVFKLQR